MKTLASLRQSGRDRRARAAAGVNVPPEPTGVAPNQKLELNALAAALTGGATQSNVGCVRPRYTSTDQTLPFSLVLMRFDGSAGQEIVASAGRRRSQPRASPCSLPTGHGVAPGV